MAEPKAMTDAEIENGLSGTPMDLEEAQQCVLRFINSHFNNVGKPEARIRIPCDPKVDDDCRLMDHVTRMARTVEARDAEIARLRKIESALPRTADGVPITYGMTVWYHEEEAPNSADLEWWTGDFLSDQVTGVYIKNFEEYNGDVSLGVHAGWEGGNEEVYSTREAALAAANAGKDAK